MVRLVLIFSNKIELKLLFIKISAPQHYIYIYTYNSYGDWWLRTKLHYYKYRAWWIQYLILHNMDYFNEFTIYIIYIYKPCLPSVARNKLWVCCSFEEFIEILKSLILKVSDYTQATYLFLIHRIFPNIYQKPDQNL